MPCDAVLLHGACIANEATLTGENLPRKKESIFRITREDGYEDDTQELNLHSKMLNRYLVFSGTEIIKTESQRGAGQSDVHWRSLLPPNNGCLALVVRTGFDTTQVCSIFLCFAPHCDRWP
jgi:manganese-transporting P-type ATPase